MLLQAVLRLVLGRRDERTADKHGIHRWMLRRCIGHLVSQEEVTVMNSATDNEMCAMCRKIRPDKYQSCKEICKALIVFLNLTPEEAEVYKPKILGHEDEWHH